MDFKSSLLTALVMFGLCGCNNSEKTAAEFCQAHTKADLARAYQLLSQRDQIETPLNSYVNFTWDQRTFDLRLLQGHDQCAVDIKRLNEEQALATLHINRHGGDQPFSCLLPLRLEDGQWRVVSQWAAATDYLESRTRLRQELPLRYADMINLDFASYQEAAAVPLQEYFARMGEKSTMLKNSVGGVETPFCLGRVNPDGGYEMAMNYLIFENKLAAFPADWLAQQNRYRHYIEDLQKGYKPLATTTFRTVRMDLAASEVVRQKQENGRTQVLVQHRFLFWGKVHGPLSWQLAILDKSGQVVQEGFGKEAELITDFPDYLPGAPDLTMAVINLPRLPNYTNKVLLTFIEPDQMTKYQLEIPLLADYLESGRK